MKKIIFILIFLITALPVLSQSPEWINYTTSDNIRALASEGNYLWIGGTNGLTRMDKTSGEMYFFNCANSDLPENLVNCIKIDKFSNKWICTPDGGLAKFDGTNWSIYDTTNSRLPVNNISCIVIDKSNNKWIGTWGGGLVCFNDSTWIIYNTKNSTLPSDNIQALEVDSSGNIWASSDKLGLVKFDGKNWQIFNETNCWPLKVLALSLKVDLLGNLYIGTAGHGLIKFDGANWKAYDTNQTDYGAKIYSMIIDSKNNLWLITTGIWKFDGINWIDTKVYDLTAFTIDNNDDIWLFHYHRVKKYNGTLQSMGDPSNSKLPFNKVVTIAIDWNNKKWIGHNRFTVTCIDSTNWSFINNFSGYVSIINVDRNNSIWFAYEFFLSKYENNKWTTYKTSWPGDITKLPYGQIKCMALDSSNTIWIGTAGSSIGDPGGISNFDGSRHVYPGIVFPTSIAIDKHDNMWFNRSASALMEINTITGDWIGIWNTSNSILPDDYPNSISIDKDDYKWIGTNKGLYIFRDSNWTVYKTDNSGLTDNIIKNVVFDKNWNKCIITSTGLVTFDGINWTVFNRKNSALPSPFINTIAFDSLGNTWFGTDNGLAVYRPGGIKGMIIPYKRPGIPQNLSLELKNDSLYFNWDKIKSDTSMYQMFISKIESVIYRIYKSNKSGDNYILFRDNIVNNSSAIKLDKDSVGYYTVRAYLPETGLESENSNEVDDIFTDIPIEKEDDFTLSSSPNPFSESTNIKYSLPFPSHVKLSIYDIFGREVAVLVDGIQEIGDHIEHLPFTTYLLSDGIYFCRLQAGSESKVIKIVKIE